MSRPDRVEELDELPLLLRRQHFNRRIIRRVDRRVERREQLEPLRRDEAEDLSPIGNGSLTTYEARLLQLVDETRDPWRLVHHPVADRERRQSLAASAAKYAQNVVLLNRHAVRYEHLIEVPLDHRRRPQHPHDHLRTSRMKGAPLCDLLLQLFASPHLYTLMAMLDSRTSDIKYGFRCTYSNAVTPKMGVNVIIRVSVMHGDPYYSTNRIEATMRRYSEADVCSVDQ
jgi:hypothetical protein